MKDLVEKLDRLKELTSRGFELNPTSTHTEDVEAVGIALELVGEMIANSRRIACALEDIALSTKPVYVVSSGPDNELELRK